jgi:periplasmic divalent cation tolerance protein
MTRPNAVLILTTVPDDVRAEAFARTLVEERLAACVNLYGPMVSIYTWKGTVQHDVERQVVIKTVSGRVPAIEARLRELHTYELPEFIVVSVDGGGEAYLRWMHEVTTDLAVDARRTREEPAG